MPTIDDYQIPKDLIVELERIIDETPSASLKIFITSRPDLVKGFRSSHLQPKVIRQRLKTLLLAAGPLDTGLIALLAGESLNLEVVAVLSTAALALVFPLCVSYFGSSFVAASLLDDRLAVREMAVAYWTKSGGSIVGEQEIGRAAIELAQELEPFLRHIGRLVTVREDGAFGVPDVLADEPREKEIVSLETLSEYRKKIAYLEDRQLKGKEAIRLTKILNEKISSKDADLSNIRHKFSQEQKMRKSAVENADCAIGELSELKKGFAERVKLGVEKEVSSVVRGWLQQPLNIETEAQSLAGKVDSDDLLARAEMLLLRQEAVDRNMGNRKVLHERLSQLESSRDRLMTSANEALQPLSELLEVSAAVEEEIATLQATLGLSGPKNQAVVKIEARIHQAGNATELAEIKKLLFDLDRANIFLPSECTALYAAYHQQQDRLYSRYTSCADGSLPFDSDSADILRLAGEIKPFHLILDGHNIILDSEGLFPEIFAEESAGAKSRNWLLAIVDRMMQGSSCQASVFFDGSSSSVRSFSPFVKEIFSGGGGVEVKDRADQAIVSYLSALNTTDNIDLPVIVVTNDRQLQDQVKGQGAKIMPLGQFAVLAGRYYA